MAPRGCGSRIAGGVYATLELSPGGSPLEDFMICPPIPIDPGQLGLSARGVKLFERNGIFHVLDWVGTNHYPNPTDDLEEIRRMGMSARLELSSAEEYAKLTTGSRIMRVHAHAYIDTPEEHWKQRRGGMEALGYSWNLCPKHRADHTEPDPDCPPPMCLGLLYEDLILARRPDDYHPDDYDERYVLRDMPSFTYKGYRAPEGAEPVYKPGIYASFPIQRLVVVKDPHGKTHEAKTKKLKNTSLFDPETGIVNE